MDCNEKKEEKIKPFSIIMCIHNIIRNLDVEDMDLILLHDSFQVRKEKIVSKYR